MKEQWKSIPGYEDFYQVSDKGRIKKCKRWDVNKRGYIESEQILKPFDNGHGYLVISLSKEGRKTNHYIHRLVASAFIDNPTNKGYVNHLDYNRKNNVASNLEWCTQKENAQYSSEHMKRPRRVKTNTGEFYIHRKKDGYYRVTIAHKQCGYFKRLEDAITRRNEVLERVRINNEQRKGLL